MKQQILIIFLLCVISITINAQSIDRNTIAAAGGSALVNDHYIDWTIGESVIETIYNDEYIISEGFHQPIETFFLYRIDGNILGDGLPYSDAEVFLYIADAGISVPALLKSETPKGSFRFSFIPEDNYILYAVPDVTDKYYPTYYLQTIDRNKAYVLDADANIGGLDLQLVSKYDSMDEIKHENGFDFFVFPNPFFDNLNISINTDYQSTYKVKIIDLMGKIVVFKEVSSNEIFTLDLLYLPNGSYIVNIENDQCTFNKLISKVKYNSY